VDHGLTGADRNRSGRREAMAACRGGDTFVVTKLDRLARSVRDAHQIVDQLAQRNVKLSIGGSVHDRRDPVGKLLFNVLAMVAEFESDLIRARTREGMKIAKAKGRLRGKKPKLSPTQEAHLVKLHDAGEHTTRTRRTLFRRQIHRKPGSAARTAQAGPAPLRCAAHGLLPASNNNGPSEPFGSEGPLSVLGEVRLGAGTLP
jgi:DNA invertase Pin-like site-specific DNA recombinase